MGQRLGQGLSPQEPARASLVFVLLAVGLGTYLARAVPLLLALRARASAGSARRDQENDPEPGDERCHPDGRPSGGRQTSKVEQRCGDAQELGDVTGPLAGPAGWLGLVAPSVMAALLVSSLLPARWGPEAMPVLVRHLFALAAAWTVARRFRHMGLTVLVGMAAAWLVSAAL